MERILRHGGKMGLLAIGLLVLAFALACSSSSSEPTPMAPATPAPAMAPTAVAVPTVASAQAAPTATAAVLPTATPTRVLPTATPVGQKAIYGGVLNYVSGGSTLRSLDPGLSVDPGDNLPLFNIYDTIAELGFDGSLSPSLAKSWDISSAIR